MRQIPVLAMTGSMLLLTLPMSDADTSGPFTSTVRPTVSKARAAEGPAPAAAQDAAKAGTVRLRNVVFGYAKGWGASVGSFTIAAGAGRHGTSGAVLSPSSSGAVSFSSKAVPSTVPRGQRYLGGLWVKAVAGTTVEVSLVSRDGSTVTSSGSATATFARTGWRRISVAAPSRADGGTIRLGLAASGLSSAETVVVDDAALFRGRVLSNGCPMDMRGIAPCATLVGQAYGSNADPAGLEKRFGRPLGVHRTYWRADQLTGAVRQAREDLAVGRLPWLSFKPPHDWAKMAAGAGDGWARTLTRRFAKLPGPVWVAIHHEPEDDGNVTPWTAMQKRLAPIVRDGSWNIGYTIILMGYHQVYGPKGSPLRLPSLWPKHTRVDVAGFDIYNNYGQKDGGEVSRHTTNLGPDYFRYLSRWARKHHTHWGLAESGFTDLAAKDDPNWVLRSVKQMMRRGGLAYSYFNTSLNTSQTFALASDHKKDLYQRALDISPSF